MHIHHPLPTSNNEHGHTNFTSTEINIAEARPEGIVPGILGQTAYTAPPHQQGI